MIEATRTIPTPSPSTLGGTAPSAPAASSFAQIMDATVAARAGQRAIEQGPDRDATTDAKARRRLANGDFTTHAAAVAAAELKTPTDAPPAEPQKQRPTEPSRPSIASIEPDRGLSVARAAGSDSRSSPAQPPSTAPTGKPAPTTPPTANSKAQPAIAVPQAAAQQQLANKPTPLSIATTAASAHQTTQISPARAVAAVNALAERSQHGATKPASVLRTAHADEAFAAQLQQGIAAALNQSGGTVVLRLNPAALGSLHVRLNLEGQSVAARFRVESDEARKLLEEHMPTLRTALESRGLTVDRITIDLHSNANTHSQTSPDGQRQQQHQEHTQPERKSRGEPIAPAAREPDHSAGSRSDPFTITGGALRLTLDAIA